jgi:hypothetical protein
MLWVKYGLSLPKLVLEFNDYFGIIKDGNLIQLCCLEVKLLGGD